MQYWPGVVLCETCSNTWQNWPVGGMGGLEDVLASWRPGILGCLRQVSQRRLSGAERPALPESAQHSAVLSLQETVGMLSFSGDLQDKNVRAERSLTSLTKSSEQRHVIRW